MYKPLADSTLMGMTKKEIIEQLRIAEHNHQAMKETVNQQAENVMKLLAEERKHAHWIEHEGLCGCWICSNCNQHIFNNYGASDLYKFCPGCGAKMDEEVQK